MKIINDIIMSIKNFLSYLFKDNDPSTTDLFDANWGNGVTRLLSRLDSIPTIDFRSDDAAQWLNKDKGEYSTQSDGKSLGYPDDYMVILHLRKSQGLVYQVGFNARGTWKRVFNQAGATNDMKWISIDGLASTSRVVGGTFPTQVGWQNAVTLDVSSLGSFPYILNFRYRNTNGVWQDANKYASALQSGAGTTISVQLDNVAAAGMRFEIVVSKTF